MRTFDATDIPTRKSRCRKKEEHKNKQPKGDYPPAQKLPVRWSRPNEREAYMGVAPRIPPKSDAIRIERFSHGTYKKPNRSQIASQTHKAGSERPRAFDRQAEKGSHHPPS